VSVEYVNFTSSAAHSSRSSRRGARSHLIFPRPDLARSFIALREERETPLQKTLLSHGCRIARGGCVLSQGIQKIDGSQRELPALRGSPGMMMMVVARQVGEATRRARAAKHRRAGHLSALRRRACECCLRDCTTSADGGVHTTHTPTYPRSHMSGRRRGISASGVRAPAYRACMSSQLNLSQTGHRRAIREMMLISLPFRTRPHHQKREAQGPSYPARGAHRLPRPSRLRPARESARLAVRMTRVTARVRGPVGPRATRAAAA
jgi:hypothetical protein